ncbi:MAG TPA: hypothetical protein VN843_24115 [Anaerolineales bacterium]|nr:hypothetical protein [Anaerolineales bacterium]
MNTLTVGTRVTGPHGLGTVVEVRVQKLQSDYVLNHPETIQQCFQLGLGSALVCTFYGADRYPYVVRFDNGYQDVYGNSEIQVVDGG